MSLFSLLLKALVDADGDAVVIHSGETPYVDGPAGQAELSNGRLTLQTVEKLLAELLPEESQRTLQLLGAIRYECTPIPQYPGEPFTIVAFRDAGEIWVEIRREAVRLEKAPVAAAPTSRLARKTPPPAEARSSAPIDDDDDIPFSPDVLERLDDSDLEVPDAEDLWPGQGKHGPLRVGTWSTLDAPIADESEGDQTGGLDLGLRQPGPPPPRRRPEATRKREPPAAAETPPPKPIDVPQPSARVEPDEEPDNASGRSASILPLTRQPIRRDAPQTLAKTTGGPSLSRLLHIVAARGGSILYVASGTPPSMRIDGEIHTVEGEPTLSAEEVEALVLGIAPERSREALRSASRTEWIAEVPELGRVRCVTFRDHRGAGGIFRMVAPRPATAEQLGLPREVQVLAIEPEGLILVAGPRSSGKSTLIAALVDVVNRTRRDYVITIESEVQVIQHSQGAMISQREVRGDDRELLAAIQGALREDPDVLVIEELWGAPIVRTAVEAAGSGRLVIAGVPAHSATEAVDRVIDEYSPEERRHAQLALSANLRGIIAQVLVRKPLGGRLAAREILLNTPAVAGLIADGRTSQLPLAIEAGRQAGMMALNDSLAALVKTGAVDAHEAYRRAADRRGFVEMLKRNGIDTSALERLA